MFSNKLKKGSVAVAVVTSMMIGSAFANTYACAPAGASSWKSKVVSKTTTEHAYNTSEYIAASASTTTTINSTSKFNGEYSKQMYAEAKKRWT